MQGRLNDHQGINSGAVHAMLKDSLTVNWHHLLYTFECVCRQARPANSTRYLLQFMLLYTSHFISREYCCNLIDELPPHRRNSSKTKSLRRASGMYSITASDVLRSHVHRDENRPLRLGRHHPKSESTESYDLVTNCDHRRCL